MKRFSISLFLLVLAASLGVVSAQDSQSTLGNQPSDVAVEATPPPVAPIFPNPGTTRLVDQKEVEQLIITHGSDLLVVNMWATYCGPCVEELPYFIELANKYDKEKVLVLGISLDFKNQVEKRVIPFLTEKKVPYPVVVFAGSPGPMIDFLAPEWKGDLPATFFYDKKGNEIGKYLRAVEKEELNQKVETLLQELESKKQAVSPTEEAE
jgi:thiol-disulfide isomerase/thioredoxin